MCAAAGWNQTGADWLRLIEAEISKIRLTNTDIDYRIVTVMARANALDKSQKWANTRLAHETLILGAEAGTEFFYKIGKTKNISERETDPVF